MSNENVLRHLIVDSGAIIKEVNIVGLAENLWTVSDVIEEIRDKRARHVLENLPKELKVREPSATSIARVVEFAKKTGDLRSLSTADLRVLALTYMLEVETRGSSGHLRKEPLRAGAAVQFKKGKFSKLVEDGNEKQQQKKQIKSKKQMTKEKSPLDLVYGLTVIVRGLSSRIDEQELRKRFSIFGTIRFLVIMRSKNGKSRGFGFITFENESEAKRSLEMSGEILMKKELNIAMWVEKKKEEEKKKKEVEVAVVSDVREEEVVVEVEKDEEKEEEEKIEEKKKIIATEPATRPTKPFSYASALRSQNKIVQQQPKKKSSKKKKVVSFNARSLVKSNRDEITEKKFLELEKRFKKEKESNETGERKSHILGPSSSLVKSVMISKEENEKDNEGWIDPLNESAISMASLSGKDQQLETRSQAQSVGCITLDFAMQNVLTQIGLHVVAPDGRVIKRVKQWVLHCSACFNIESDMSKLFCSKCGHNTLRKLGVTLRKDGTKQYHYSKKSELPQRGARYSIPKRKGGRKNDDILLCEDQLLMGKWRLQAGKKSSLSSMFGEGITESLGMRVAAGTNVVVGYGRQNPNARRGRERRGAKKKNKNRRR
eukprot:g5264.t1